MSNCHCKDHLFIPNCDQRHLCWVTADFILSGCFELFLWLIAQLILTCDAIWIFSHLFSIEVTARCLIMTAPSHYLNHRKSIWNGQIATFMFRSGLNMWSIFFLMSWCECRWILLVCGEKLTLVQLMAWCSRPESHNLSQCRFIMHHLWEALENQFCSIHAAVKLMYILLFPKYDKPGFKKKSVKFYKQPLQTSTECIRLSNGLLNFMDFPLD